jgi:hypothetical protein
MAEESKGAGLRFGTIITLVPLVTAAFGGLQYYRDQQQREFQAITFYLQNQSIFDPCTDVQLANLNLGMIEETYPNVYASLVDHVETRASQCDSSLVIAQEGTSAATAAPVTTPAPETDTPTQEAPASSAPSQGATRGVMLPKTPNAPADDAPAQQTQQAPTRQMRVQIPSTTDDASAYFRNRYNRIASLPTSRARKVEDGRYRVYIQISSETSRPEAAAISETLKKEGHSAPTIELVPVRVARPELRFYQDTQAADAQKMADAVETVLAANGQTVEVSPVFVGEGRPGLPPGTMELWLP